MSNLPDRLTRGRLTLLENEMARLCAEGGILETRGSREYRERMGYLKSEYKRLRKQQTTIDFIHEMEEDEV